MNCTITFCHYGTNDQELDVVVRASGDRDSVEIEIESVDGPDGRCLNEDTVGMYGVTWTDIESVAWEMLDGEMGEPEEGDDSEWDYRCDHD